MIPAIVSLLWSRNQHVLESYISSQHATVLTLRGPYAGGGDDLRARIRASGGDVIYLDDLVTPELNATLRIEAAGRAESAIEGFDGSAASRPFAQYGLGPKQFDAIFSAAIVDDFVVTMRIVEALSLATQRYAIELMVLNEDVGLASKACALWAASNGVPTLNVSHSAAIATLAPAHHERHTTDVVFFGEKATEAYVVAGIDMRGSHLIGNPAWDIYTELLADRTEARRRLQQRYGIPDDRQIVVFATTWASNFYAFAEEDVYEDSLRAAFTAYGLLAQRESYHFVVKDRSANAHLFARVREIAAQAGIAPDSWTFLTDDLPSLMVCAAVAISVNSNVTIEAAICGIPAINLWSPASWLIGPYFDALDGVLEVEPDELSPALERMLNDESFRRPFIDASRAALKRVNATSDGSCANRIATLMRQLRKPSTAVGKLAAFDRARLDTCLANVEGTYRHALEVSGGEVAPSEQTNFRRVSAATPSGALTADDLLSAGVRRGEVDLAIFAHSLEEIVDPWAALSTVRSFLAADARIVVTVDNLRSLRTIESLVRGDYGKAATPEEARRTLRRFTAREVVGMLNETGFRVTKAMAVLDPAYASMQLQNGPGTATVELSNTTLKAVPFAELGEWTATEFILTAQPA